MKKGAKRPARAAAATKSEEKLAAAFQNAADWASKRATLASSQEELATDLREWRQLIATAADVVVKNADQFKSREEVIRRFWKSWVEIAELESALKRGKNTSRVFAKIISRDLKTYAKTISRLAEIGNKQFFIDLGKCLSGDIKSDEVDRQKCDIASMLCSNPSIPIKEAVRELKERCGWEMTEDAFKMAKMRLAEFPRKRVAIRSRR